MIYDISQELLESIVFPGDPIPKRTVLSSLAAGDACNLSSLSLCAHNGTHVDAPYHFIPEGKTIEALPLSLFVGNAFLARGEGLLSAIDAYAILEHARSAGAPERILIGGPVTVTAEAAKAFRDAGILLIGNESQTVGPEDAPKEVHEILLGAGIILLEGIRLGSLPEGKYFLAAQPINIKGCDGAPVRAILISD